MEKKIILKTYNAPPMNPPDVVRITPEAGAIVRALQRETGLTARSIVSQIIVQAEALIECKQEKEIENG